MTSVLLSEWNDVAIPERVRERAHTKWEPDGDCWISTYSVASHGYAQVGWGEGGESHVVLAHRASWEFANGPMEKGMTLDHLCKNRRCVNPDHLRAIPNFENARRTSGKDWPLGVCSNGHSNKFLESDSRRSKSGKPRIGLRCSECKKLYNRRYKWRRDNPGQPYPPDLLLGGKKLPQAV